MKALIPLLVTLALALGAGSTLAGPLTPGKSAACTGGSGLLGVAISPAFTDTMSVVIQKVKRKEFLQIQSTIQCDTGAGGVFSRIRIEDGAGHAFFADPDPTGAFPVVCGAGDVFFSHTGIWWFNPADAPGFAFNTDVIVTRQDTATASGSSIGFRSLCVNKTKK
jgi:hypothetical protein